MTASEELIKKCRDAWGRMTDETLIAEVELWEGEPRGEALKAYINRYRPNLFKEAA